MCKSVFDLKPWKFEIKNSKLSQIGNSKQFLMFKPKYMVNIRKDLSHFQLQCELLN